MRADSDCVHCTAPATHRHTLTSEPLCCGHAATDIDAKPIRADHDCVKFYSIERASGELECDHRANPNPPTGDLVPCHEPAAWRVVTSRFPGDPFAPNHPGAPTSSRYCPEHFTARLGDILDSSPENALDVRPRN